MIMSQTFLKKTLKKKMIVTQHFQNIVLKKSREIMIRRSQKLVLQELWLRKCSPGISFTNTNLPNNGIRMIKYKKELELLSNNSTNIFRKA